MYNWTIHSRKRKHHDMLCREKDIQGHLLRTEMNPVLLDGDTGHTKEEKTGVGKQRRALKARRKSGPSSQTTGAVSRFGAEKDHNRNYALGSSF